MLKMSIMKLSYLYLLFHSALADLFFSGSLIIAIAPEAYTYENLSL